jgi:hypothetical protein
MKIFAWIFAFPLLFVVGCRTYVGSDDVYKTDPPEVLKKETGLELKRGVILEVKNGRYILTFAEKSVTEQREKTKTYYCGREYYYLHMDGYDPFLDPRCIESPFAKVVISVFVLPIILVHDGFCSWGFDWKLRGKYAPGIGYCIAYLPIVHLFCAPVLRPPYAYKKTKYDVEFDKKPTKKLTEETTYIRRISNFAFDSSQSEVLITCDGKSIKNNLSPDGKIEFDIADFPDAAIEDGILEFTILHTGWDQSWRIRTSSLADPEAISCWNILSGAKYDYASRFAALIRLEPVLGEKRCREYMQKLLAGELNI